MNFYAGRDTFRDPHKASAFEWIETNGLGGWASSTITCANTRRYHGLLVTAGGLPGGRMVMLSKMDETILSPTGSYELGSNFYPGLVHPHGHEFMEKFSKDPFPRFEYKAGPFRISKTVFSLNGENTTGVIYEALEAPHGFFLELRPMVAGRGYHDLMSANDSISAEARFPNGVLKIVPYPGIPELFIWVPGAEFLPDPVWYYNFEYPAERQRGLDFREDLFCHGSLRVPMNEGQKIFAIISDRNPYGRDAQALLLQESGRRKALLKPFAGRSDFAGSLALAADQFIVKKGDGRWKVIAGYHWFTDWGRDTMISLPGLVLVTGRYEEARDILREFASRVSEGMIPNFFPDNGTEPEYNTADASLWFFVSVYRYLEYTGDIDFVREDIMPALEEIMEWHERGTRYGIGVDSDGLLSSGEPGVQLTWMDARIGDRVVTPRHGKAVEINALWYNSLRIFGELLEKTGEHGQSALYKEKAGKALRRFGELFWDPEKGCLFDFVHGDYKDPSIRPNQIFALSLPFALLSGERALSVLEVVERELLTPMGLRTLSPRDPGYTPRYEGDPVSRDSAYHQGTVWPWLFGPYIRALVRIRGSEGRVQGRKLIDGLRPHLEEACIGSISEVFDADEPHRPGGCIAQAWSVAEILRVLSEEGIDVPAESDLDRRSFHGQIFAQKRSVETGAAASEKILLFVKTPVPGEVKTRLAPALGAEKAAALYRKFVLDLLLTLRDIKVPVTVLFHPERYEDLVREWLGQGLEYLAQEGNDLGQRLRSAFSHGFEGGSESLLALGGDTPDIPGPLILEAFSSLEEYPSVLIPAIDGGYAAIGFTREGYCPEVFRGIPWGTNGVFRKTLDILSAKGVQARILTPWQDVDTPGDLDDLVKRLERSKLCPNVREFFKSDEARGS